MPLVADLELPTFPGPARPGERATLWIATDAPPFRAQQWPVLMPPPPGWHEITAEQAAQLAKPGTISISFLPDPAPTSLESEAAALSTAAPDQAGLAARRRSRVPREPRLPRSPRAPRTPRSARPPRPQRAPRPPRYPRRPKKPRAARKPRTPRPKNYKTKQDPGICKGPACTCWTPGGCVGRWYIELLPSFTASDCYRGPCYSYEACVTEKCQVHAGCLLNTILQFWARQYRAVVAYAEPVVTAAAREGRRLLAAVEPGALPPGELADVAPSPAPAYTAGCPAGWYWTIGLTGARCADPAFNLPPATRAQVTAILGYDPGFGFGAGA